MATPRVTIDELPEQTLAEDDNYIVVQDTGISKKMSVATLKTGVSDLLTAHIIDPTDAHDATAISTTTSGAGVDGVTVQAQLGQLAMNVTATETVAATLAAHIADTDDAHDASAISAAADPTLTGNTVQAQLTSAGVLIEAIEGGVEGPPGPPGPGVAAGGLVGQVLTKVSSTDYDANWQTPTGGGGGGTGVADGDHGDIVVTDSGVTWTLDPTVISAAARTVLDDATVADMRTTLGAQTADADLTAVANNATDGLITRTGSGTATGRTIQGTGSRITVTNGSGVAGDPTIDVGANVYVVSGTDVPVSDGGTGRSTSGTAYGLLAAGTTATGAHQTVTPGTSGHLLVSQGGATLPGFRAGTKADVGLSNVDNTADASKPTFTSSTAGIVPASGGGSTNFLRADGTFAAPPGGGGGGIAGITVSEAGAALDTDITTLDFQAGFDLTESPENEVNIALDLSEYTGAALPVASGGTGATDAATAVSNLGAQPLDADLTALAVLATTGVVARTGAGTVEARTITGTTNRIAVNDGNGVSGNPTLDIGTDVVTLTGTQTLTNKTVALGSNTVSGTTTQFNTAISDADFYTTGGTDVAVVDGGTGRSTGGTAYGLLAAGTTATGVQQTVTPSASGFLKTTSTSSLPLWAAIAEADVTGLTAALAAKVPTSTTLTTTAPLTIGGGASADLSANRTLAVTAASDTAVGVVELATAAEVLTGTDTTRAVTAAGAAGAFAPKLTTINAQTGTTYTLVLADLTKLVTLTNAAAVTLTVPTNASVAFPVGATIDLAQLGAGQVTVAAAGGVTVNATPGLKFRAQYAAASLIKLATDTWLLVGDLST